VAYLKYPRLLLPVLPGTQRTNFHCVERSFFGPLFLKKQAQTQAHSNLCCLSSLRLTIDNSIVQFHSIRLNSMDKPRPIHTLSRDLRDVPDEAEPSYSYEDSAFLARSEDDVEDEFHRRLGLSAISNNNSSSHNNNNSTSGNNNNNNNSKHHRRDGSGSSTGSFWRTDVSPSFPSLAKPDVTVKERKTSGGLLGAALQLHSHSHSQTSNNTTTNNNSHTNESSNSSTPVRTYSHSY
jgi:hypothetical protein